MVCDFGMVIDAKATRHVLHRQGIGRMKHSTFVAARRGQIKPVESASREEASTLWRAPEHSVSGAEQM